MGKVKKAIKYMAPWGIVNAYKKNKKKLSKAKKAEATEKVEEVVKLGAEAAVKPEKTSKSKKEPETVAKTEKTTKPKKESEAAVKPEKIAEPKKESEVSEKTEDISQEAVNLPKASKSKKTAKKKTSKKSKKVKAYLKYAEEKKEKDTWKKSYVGFCKKEKLEDSWVLYESHYGVGMVCNPLAIFKEFMKRDDFGNYIHAWVIKDEEERILLSEEYSLLKNVVFIVPNSKEYAYFLAKSKYLINNTSFNPVFSKREGQIFLNTWHSITVKSLGYDTPDGPRVIKNMLRSMLQSDYIISANDFMTGIYDNSFRLRNIYTGKYIEEGYPRNDLTLSTDREEMIKKLERRGTIVDRNKKIILYAPTWSGNSASNPVIDMSKYTDLRDYLSNNIDMNEYQILIKPHHVVYRRLSGAEKASGTYVSYTIDANELLSIVDILITDYSSIYFDYLVAKKPILFYIPDYENYSKIRGIYFKIEELPGPCSFELASLADNINHIASVSEKHQKILNDTHAWACKHDNGKVSEKILNILLDKNTEPYHILEAKKTNKKTILLYIGSLVTNGVTSAALSLLKSIDYEKYDVTLFVVGLTKEEQDHNFDKIPSEVRTVLRVSGPTFATGEADLYKEGIKVGMGLQENLPEFKAIMKREYERVLGATNFDYIVDFWGYGSYFTSLAIMSGYNQNAKKFIWQHSDMAKDLGNEQKKLLNKNKVTREMLLANYSCYDKIVSSTKEVCAMNKAFFSSVEDEHKYTWSTNMMDKERIESLLEENGIEYHENTIQYTISDRGNNIREMIFIPFDDNKINFVTMGRCMPEKNHEAIIRAIKYLVDEGIDCALYIVGDGHLRGNLEELGRELGIQERDRFKVCVK